MKCKNCGSDIDQNAKFCGQCGTPVEFEEELIENCTEDIKEEKQVKENDDIQEKLDEIVEEVTNEDDSEKSFENADGERIENTSELFEEDDKSTNPIGSQAFEENNFEAKSESNEKTTEVKNSGLVKPIALAACAVMAIFALVYAIDLIKLIFYTIGGIF